MVKWVKPNLIFISLPYQLWVHFCHTRSQLTIPDHHIIQLRAEDRVWPCSAIACWHFFTFLDIFHNFDPFWHFLDILTFFFWHIWTFFCIFDILWYFDIFLTVSTYSTFIDIFDISWHFWYIFDIFCHVWHFWHLLTFIEFFF